jgi:3-hydroxybutyryl-CoA dehydratase
MRKGGFMPGKTIAELNVGDMAQFTKTITDADIVLFAGITGDLNPAHIDEEYARGTFFKTRIAHGILLAGFISSVIGTQLPGPGAIYVSQELNFLAPARPGDTITARVEVSYIDAERNRVTLKTTCTNQDGRAIIDGQAVVSPRKAPK